ncbi:MAG: type II toxin-antitoxin system PemK/MazF family toxin [Patescibacteria group bacterium]|nr:type II toxin-antitoxin system PemK/MazF family toxin [Patescibacteria group bacterium]
MKKEYSEWHKKKKILNEREDIDTIFFREKEVWWTALGVNVGFEQDGKGGEFRRPVLILKKFNKYVVLIVPLTTKIKKDNKYYVSCLITNDNLPRMAIISQVRLIDTKRFIDKLGVADDTSYSKIKNAIKAML